MRSSVQNSPTVSVLMPVYNAGSFLQSAIDSILFQSFNDFEFIIINDGSSDESEMIIQSYDDPRIRYIKNESNLRLIRTLNKGLAMATGEFIARMDADDIAEPDRLEKQISFMKDNPNIGVCGSWFQSFGLAENPVKYPTDDFSIRYTSLYQCPFCHPTVILRTNVIRKNQLEYSMDFPHAEDYEFWLRTSRVTQMANVPHYLLKYRQHESSISKVESQTQDSHSLRIRRMFFLEAGLSVTDEELDLFRNLNYQYNQFDIPNLERIGMLLCDIIEACRLSGYLESGRLTELLSDKWYHLCTNHSRYGNVVWKLFWSIPLLSSKFKGSPDSVRFLAKVAVRKN